MTADHATRALSFGAQAAMYDVTRPSYPDSLIDELASRSEGLLSQRTPPQWMVVDVGAGTGKLTRLLAARGWQVAAVEPDAGMREVLAATTEGITVLAGQGESIPLPEESVELLTYAQAWHWVDEPAAVAEAARVLRPGGVLALIWNVRGVETGWTAEVDTLTCSGAHRSDLEELAHDFDGFTALPVAAFPWTETLTRADLMRRATTWSAVATLPDAERSDLLARLTELLDTHPETAGVDPLEQAQTTMLFGYRKI